MASYRSFFKGLMDCVIGLREEEDISATNIRRDPCQLFPAINDRTGGSRKEKMLMLRGHGRGVGKPRALSTRPKDGRSDGRHFDIRFHLIYSSGTIQITLLSL